MAFKGIKVALLCLLYAVAAKGDYSFDVSTFGTLKEIYFDGVSVTPKANADDPDHGDTYNLTTMPKVIALRVEDDDFLSSFILADLKDHDGNVVMKSGAMMWKCKDRPVKKDWADIDFKMDEEWYSPIEFAANNFEGEEHAVNGISLDAKWLSTRLGVSSLYCIYKGEMSYVPGPITNQEAAINHMTSELISTIIQESNPLGTIVKALLKEKQLELALKHSEFQSVIARFLSNDMLSSNPKTSDYLALFDRLLTKNVLSIELFVPDFMMTLNLDDALALLEKVIEKVTYILRPYYDYVIKPDESYPVPVLGETACGWPRYDCSKYASSKYRTIDGSCNNLDNPNWGKANIPFKRVLKSAYGDGVSTMRIDTEGRPLPNERGISFTLAEEESHPHPYNTLAVMVFGQFLDHDITLTPLATAGEYGDIEDVNCGEDNCQLDHPACLPITVPADDPFFADKQPCIGFIRSRPVPSMPCDGDNVREQMNAQTAFIDASQVYGRSKEESDHLRVMDDQEGVLGTLIETEQPDMEPLLMESDTGCEVHNSTHHCFAAGDPRVNEHHGLTSFHTVFAREHNRVVDKLAELNPSWGGEKLFQEARRIVGAIMQHIVFNEYLPVIVGKKKMMDSGLEPLQSGYFTGYDKTVDPSMHNEFSTAAYRFGHSLITNRYMRADEHWNTDAYEALTFSNQVFRPALLYDGLDPILRGLFVQSTQKCDRYYSNQITDHLFTLNPPHGAGSDLFVLNIRRAREHGISGYNNYREYCGLPRAASFDNFTEIFDYDEGDTLGIIKGIYSNVDDVDLYAALIAEKAMNGAMVGPTIACLIMEQFRNLKVGDRFFYENSGPAAFTEDQLNSIRTSSLAGVMCRNSDNIDTIQPIVLHKPFREAFPTNDYTAYHVEDHGLTAEEFNTKWMNNYNARVNCADLPDLDFSAWQE